MAWTNPRTWVALETPTAAMFNSNLRDNLNHIGPPFRKYKTAETLLTSQAVLQDDPHLVIPVAANLVMPFDAYILCYSVDGTNDLKFTFWGPAGSSGNFLFSNAAGTFSTTAPTALGTAVTYVPSGAGIIRGFLVRGFFLNGGTAGDFKFQWCQNVSDPDAVAVRNGSWLVGHPFA